MWDLRPAQFAGIGGMEAKMTGIFTYGPGRVPPPIHLGISAGLIAGSFPPANGNLMPGVINPIRQSKRLYIGNVADALSETILTDFFNKLMHENKLAGDEPGEPVTEAQVNLEKGYAFIEFRTPEEATAAMAFDGVTCENIALRVRRPKDFVGIDPSLGSYNSGLIGTTVTDSPNKLFVGGIPTYLADDQVMELLKSFGELRSFNLVKDGVGPTAVSKGFAFAEYLDATVTEMAIQGLNNFELGDRTLVVQRAAVGRNAMAANTGIPQAAMPGTAGFMTSAASNILQHAISGERPTSRVMLLLNMVTQEELYSDEDYKDILEDINEECGKYGEIESVRVPRPVPKSKKWETSDSAVATAEKNRKVDEEAGVGRVYVLYRELESTIKAMKAIGGRQFGGRTILVASVPEDEFLGPAPPPPPPEDLDAAAENAVKDIMSDLLN
ncbi:splicing factor U2AF 65 kDa subunit, partial [Tremellales sp. Uapishka_1]